MINKRKYVISQVILFFANVISFPLASFLYNKTLGEILRNGIFSLFFALGVLYFYFYSFHYGKLDYDNADHPFRFVLIYTLSIVLCEVFPLIDRKAWFFLLISVSILLFSNAFMAFYSVSGFIFYTALLSNSTDVISCIVYLLASYLGILLFLDIDKSFKVGSSIFISVIIQFVLEIAGFVFLDNVELSAEQFILPIINVAISGLTLIFVLKYFNQTVVNHYRNKYQELNDQEYKALIALKEISKHEYYRSIHTAYLAERMAYAIGCNVDTAKNCAYYHRIKKVFSFTQAECEVFTEDNDFPPDAKILLLNFLNKDSKLISKEAGIVYISDRVIASLMTIFEKDNKIKINYEDFMDTLFKKDYFIEALSESDLSQKDMKTILQILIKENLYYDFLR